MHDRPELRGLDPALTSPSPLGAARSALPVLAYLPLASALSSLPSRLALARHQAQLGSSFAAHLAVGLLVDVRDWLPVLAVFAVVLSLASRALGWR